MLKTHTKHLRNYSPDCKCTPCQLVTKTRQRILQATRPAGKGVTDDMVEMWNQVVKEHSCQARFEPTRLRHHTVAVGPRHDPYQQEVFYVYRFGHEYRFVSCGLSGYSLTIDGSLVYKSFDQREAIEEIMKQRTGYTMQEWEKFYWKMESRRPVDPYEEMYGRNY